MQLLIALGFSMTAVIRGDLCPKTERVPSTLYQGMKVDSLPFSAINKSRLVFNVDARALKEPLRYTLGPIART